MVSCTSSVRRVCLFGLAAASCGAAQNGTDFEARCNALVGTLSGTIPNATIWTSSPVAAGTNLSLPDRLPACGTPYITLPSSVGDFCRVTLAIATSVSSEASYELWLPTNWTGRLASAGNGGFGGCVGHSDLAYLTSLGFASISGNAGHNGTSASVFLNNSAALEDWVYRSIPAGVEVGQIITEKFYEEEIGRKYYLGCSTGGRQGFHMAQEFPGLFDGIVVGAPALAQPNLTSWQGSFFPLTGDSSSESFLSSELWGVVHEDVLRQCDGLDGYEDGILEDPRLCRYRPEALICPTAGGNETVGKCLTGKQAETVRKVFEPLHGEDGSLVYPRMQPGAEIGSASLLYGGVANAFPAEWFRYVVYEDVSFDPATLGVEDYTASAKQNAFGSMTWNGDLSGMKERGGKILHYHGLADPLISSESSARYYDHVARTMGMPSGELDGFYRYFGVSGMGHCGGGNGATFVGQGLGSSATSEPEGNVLMALVKWVEEGQAPETIQGTAFEGTEVAFTRRHCRYPLRNVYDGVGDATSADSWSCVE